MIARSGLGPLALAVALAACTVEGEEVATTFADPTANPSGTPPATSEGDTEATAGSSGTASSSGAADSGDTSTPASGSGSEGGSSGTMPVDEQPENGMYSACTVVGDCVGLTTCVLVGASGFCSSGGCADPVADCDPNPSATSTAPALCVDDGTGTMMVCALSCAGGQTCPGGMDCLPLGTTMVCA